jgi:hypothetical protein
MPRKRDAVFLVEDALSAEKVGKYADAVAILTTTAGDDLKNKLVGTYKHVVVWLDDDNVDVRRKQLALKTMFDPYVKVTVLHTSRDPKRHTDSEIERIVDHAMRPS